MYATKLSLFALILFIGATILVLSPVTTIAQAQCNGSCPVEYTCNYNGDLLSCGPCALPDYDRSAGSYHYGWGQEYRCDLCGCAWVH